MQLKIVSLRVKDWDRMIAFYQEVLGLKPVWLQPEHGYAQLDAGGINVSLFATDEAGDSPGDRLSLQFEVEDLPREMAALETLGCEFFDKQVDQDEGYQMASFRDPEGNRISIYQLMG